MPVLATLMMIVFKGAACFGDTLLEGGTHLRFIADKEKFLRPLLAASDQYVQNARWDNKEILAPTFGGKRPEAERMSKKTLDNMAQTTHSRQSDDYRNLRRPRGWLHWRECQTGARIIMAVLLFCHVFSASSQTLQSDTHRSDSLMRSMEYRFGKKKPWQNTKKPDSLQSVIVKQPDKSMVVYPNANRFSMKIPSYPQSVFSRRDDFMFYKDYGWGNFVTDILFGQ